jgi:hypothetical protein
VKIRLLLPQHDILKLFGIIAEILKPDMQTPSGIIFWRSERNQEIVISS